MIKKIYTLNYIHYNYNDDTMKIEKWIYEGKEIEVPIIEEEEVEKNEDFDIKLEDTLELSEELKNIGDINE